MFEQDYIVRMFVRLAEAIRRSIQKADGDHDPASAADMIEAAVGEATELDGGVFLSLVPESMTSILQVSGTDPRVVEYIVRSLLLEAKYLEQTHNNSLALLRTEQAHALAQGFDIDLTEEAINPEELDAFFDETLKRAQ